MAKAKKKLQEPSVLTRCLKKVPNFAVCDAGLSVHLSFPFIGANPDGKVYDPSENPSYGLLEIKCPFSKRKDTFVQASGDGTFYLEDRENSFHLKETIPLAILFKFKGSLESQASSRVTFVFISLKQMR